MCRSLHFPALTLPIFLFLAASPLTSFARGNPLSLPLPSHVLYQFPNVTWVENLAVRSCGDILATLLTSPELYLIDTSPHPTARLVHSFPTVSGLFGIAELHHDIFYVAAGNFSLTTFVSMPKSYSVWEVDMRSFSRSGARVRKVTDILEAVFFNGLVALSKEDNTILIADSALGLAWKVDVESGAYSVGISVPSMAPIPTAEIQIGINGVKIRDGHLYFTNKNQGLLARVPIAGSGRATGDVQVLAMGIAPDDFDLDREGKPWIAQNSQNVISVVLPNGTVVNVLGAMEQQTVAGPSSCVFGEARQDWGAELFDLDRVGEPWITQNSQNVINVGVPNRTMKVLGATEQQTVAGPSNCGFGEDWGAESFLTQKRKGPILYCSTTGGLVRTVDGTLIEGGKVVLIDTESFYSCF